MSRFCNTLPVMPAKAGICCTGAQKMPAFAGMTDVMAHDGKGGVITHA